MLRINIEDQRKRIGEPPIINDYGGINKKRNPNEELRAGCGCTCKCPDTVTADNGWSTSTSLGPLPLIIFVPFY